MANTVHRIILVTNLGASLFLLSTALNNDLNLDLSKVDEVMSLLLFAPCVTLPYLLLYDGKKDDKSLFGLWIAVRKKKLREQLDSS